MPPENDPNNPQAPAQPESPDYAGYNSHDELVRGYRASGEEAKRQKARADQAEALLHQHLAQSAPPQNARRPEDRLAEFGIPTDALGELIDREVNSRIEKAFRPIAQMGQARNHMVSEYGNDYTKYEADVANFLQADPDRNARYQRLFNEDPAGAMEWAFLSYGRSKQSEIHQQNGSPERRSPTEAQIPNSRAGDARNPQRTQDDDLSKAFDKYMKTGQSQDFVNGRLRQVLKKQGVF